MVMLNAKQIESLNKLAVGPAVQNAYGKPIGVAKHTDGSTLNGNMLNKLMEKGLVERVVIGQREIWVRDIQQHRPLGIVEYRITATGLAAIQ